MRTTTTLRLTPEAQQVALDLIEVGFHAAPRTNWALYDAGDRWWRRREWVLGLLDLVTDLFCDHERVLAWSLARLQAAHDVQAWCLRTLGMELE